MKHSLFDLFLLLPERARSDTSQRTYSFRSELDLVLGVDLTLVASFPANILCDLNGFKVGSMMKHSASQLVQLGIPTTLEKILFDFPEVPSILEDPKGSSEAKANPLPHPYTAEITKLDSTFGTLHRSIIRQDCAHPPRTSVYAP